MGTSNWQNISYCTDLIRKIKPKTILDIGIGFGRWGIMSREFLEIWDGKLSKSQWEVEIEGIEAFTDNIESYHDYFYDKVWNMDAKEYIANCSKEYNLIVFGDVLEHFTKEDGVFLLNKSVIISDFVLINIPLGCGWEQEELYNNPYEEHKSEWNECDFSHYNIVRKRNFKDYMGRLFCTLLISRKQVINNELLFPHKITDEIIMCENEIKQHKEYKQYLVNLKETQQDEIRKIWGKGEEMIMKEKNEARNKIKIQVADKNVKAQANEVWLYHIGSNEIESLQMDKINADAHWLRREDNNSPTNQCIIASVPGAELEFEIIGDELLFKCLSHSWSGKINILKNDKQFITIDLFSNIQKVADIKVNLKDG